MITSLGVGVGVNLTLYAVVKRLALSDWLAARHPEQLVTVSPGLSYPDYLDLLSTSTTADYTIFQSSTLLWAQETATRTIGAQVVSTNYFDVLGVRPLVGRTFAADGTNPDQVLVSYRFWQQQFHENAGVVGHTLTLNGWPMTIVGVLPQDFYSAVAPMLAPKIYVPVSAHVNLGLDAREAAQFDAVGRLRPGSSLTRAAAELRVLDGRLRHDYPDVPRAAPLTALPRAGSLLQRAGGPRGLLLALLTVVATLGTLVLLIVCTNVAGVLAARTDERRRDLSIRAAIGATRRHLIGDLAIEGLLLGVISAAGAAAIWLVATLALPRIPAIASLGAVLMMPSLPVGFTIVLALLVAVICTVAPALLAARIDPARGLRPGPSAGTSGSLRAPRLLVGVQVAICALFVTIALFVTRTTVTLGRVTPNIDLSHSLVVQVRLPSTMGALATLEIERELSRIDGITSVSYGALPAAFSGGRHRVRVGDHGDVRADALRVQPGFLDTLGLRIERGRGLDRRDLATPAVTPVLVDRTFANRYLQGREALGVILTLAADTESGSREQRLEVVGVTAGANLAGPAASPTPLVFIPGEPPRQLATLVARTEGPAAAMTAAVIRTLGTRFPGASASITPLEDAFASALAPLRAIVIVFSVLAGLGAMIAMIGLHGLVSYQTSRRQFDLGVRRALGASTGSVIAVVARDAAGMVAGGIIVGLALAALAGRLLPPVAGSLPMTGIDLIAAALALLLAVALACLRPTQRALRVEAAVVLRAE